MNRVKVKINGKDIELEKSSNVAEMLIEREVEGSMFVVEKNLQIVNKEDYITTKIKENDSFEIVGFFGGG
ncbi:MAG: sulfur carrier protein ThiS [Candidatus Gastranaerophilales bacterium]|nr:sulfur carrier protein ThiS [Candidatus Gastranaerophilales bacterium]